MSGKIKRRVCERETKDQFVLQILTVMWGLELWGWEREIKGYWWSHWGPPGPSRWPSDSSSARWCSSPARHDSPEDAAINRHSLTTDTMQTLCSDSSFSLPRQNSTTLWSLKIWHVGGKAVKPGRQSPDVQMMSETEFVARNKWTTTKRFIKDWFNEADLLISTLLYSRNTVFSYDN